MSANQVFDPFLGPTLVARQPKIAPFLGDLKSFRDWVLTDVDAQARYTDRYAPPRLEVFDRNGEVANRVIFNPEYEHQHRELYVRGIVGLPYRAERAPHLLSFALGYLLSQADISLHCPATLTGAVAYVLATFASEDVRDKYLHQLTRMDGQAKSGGTWATERHGGSDVGATTTYAVPHGDRWRLHGLKWFASNANSGLALATARPQGAVAGSAGLGLYLLPSHRTDGSVNGMVIRRLKEKLGTRGLATGEIELNGAEAVEVAAPPHGLKVMMEALQYSRIHNAVGAAGVQRRTFREALQWAKERKAFGKTLIDFPMVRDELLRMRVRFEASALLAFEAALSFDRALADPEHQPWTRITTALAKYLTAEYAVESARSALELIGGNGYTGDYPIERLLRDAQVLTVWEGPANIQALELLRMLSAKPKPTTEWEGAQLSRGAQLYASRLHGIIQRIPESISELSSKLDSRLTEDVAAIQVSTATAHIGERLARRLLHRLSQSLAFALMCERALEQHANGDLRSFLSACRYYEELEAPAIGSENQRVVNNSLELIDDELPASIRTRAA